MIIALDGPAGVGKSTIALLLSKRNNLFYLNSGNFYRAVTLSLLNSKGNPEDSHLLIEHAKNFQPAIIENRFHLDGVDVEDSLHSDEVDRYVAQHSANVEVRKWVNKKIREICADKDLVCEGRDMTTVVFPDASFKFYLDAQPSVRAKRRFEQGVSNLSLQEIEESIIRRDQIDQNKAVGSLKVSEDANYIDTSFLSIEEVCEKVEKILFAKKG